MFVNMYMLEKISHIRDHFLGKKVWRLISAQNNILFETKMGTPGKNCRNPPKNGFFPIKDMQTFDQPFMDDGECAV